MRNPDRFQTVISERVALLTARGREAIRAGQLELAQEDFRAALELALLANHFGVELRSVFIPVPPEACAMYPAFPEEITMARIGEDLRIFGKLQKP